MGVQVVITFLTKCYINNLEQTIFQTIPHLEGQTVRVPPTTLPLPPLNTQRYTVIPVGKLRSATAEPLTRAL